MGVILIPVFICEPARVKMDLLRVAFVLILSAVHGKVVLCSLSVSCSCKLHLWKQYSFYLCFCCLLIYLRNFHGNVCGCWRGFWASIHQTDLSGCPLSQVGAWNQSNREGFKPVIWLHLLGSLSGVRSLRIFLLYHSSRWGFQGLWFEYSDGILEIWITRALITSAIALHMLVRIHPLLKKLSKG